MSTVADNDKAPENITGHGGRARPGSAKRWPPGAIGVMALWLVLAGIAIANTTLALQHAWINGPSWQESIASLFLATFGIALVWRGLKAVDPAASILGYSGGTLLWMGFFEWTWRNFSLLLGIDPLLIDGQAVLPPSFLLIQASTFIFLPLVVLIAANKDTRCRMMQWFRRHLRLKVPETAGNRHRHDSARVSAMETIFVIWFVYLINIALYDPRLLGTNQEVYIISLALIACWAIFLIAKLLRIPRSGLAVRYAIPTAYLLSIVIDGLTQTGLFPAFWVQPLKYPLSAACMLALFAACCYGLAKAQESAEASNASVRIP